MKEYEVWLFDLRSFTVSDHGEFASIVPEKPVELVEEGDLIRVRAVAPGGTALDIFTGIVSHEWTVDKRIQVIQAVITSVSSSR